MARLKDKVALITGAGSGIGKAAAVLLAIADINSEAGEATAEAVRALGADVLFVHTDVTDEQSVESAVQKVVHRYGTLDVCYCNAGGSSSRDGPVTEVSVNEWWRAIQVDLFGTFLVCRSGIRAMRAKGGSVITTSSIAGITGSRQNAYSAAKGGVVALTRSMAKCYRDEQIRVNAIVPGMVGTDRVLEILKPSATDANSDLRAAAICRPIDIANAALFLASDESVMITGSMIVVDRGLTSIGPPGLL
jgi:NAD(P)-dependent dehydrogenase (short-subunit alcohol dehydrogenase family)